MASHAKLTVSQTYFCYMCTVNADCLSRFPPLNLADVSGRAGRGIGSHTDYGLLVIASQDDVGGLFIRPPIENEDIRNWERSAAGFKEDDNMWKFVPPVKDVLTVFPG